MANNNTYFFELASRRNTPYHFDVAISREIAGKNFSLSFKVAGRELNTNCKKVCSYFLPDNKHSSYLDFFKKLAIDFGLRIPLNRQQINAGSDIVFQELLTQNLAPEILYGYGDPDVIKIEDCQGGDSLYYLVATSNDAPNSFPICRSKDLTEWEFVGFVFPQNKKPAWTADGVGYSDFWAPEIHKLSDKFCIYFVARDKTNLELCIGVAKSSRITENFIADSSPILKGNVIDPHVICDQNGIFYLYWKEDNNSIWPSRLTSLIYEHPKMIKKIFSEEQDRITASFIQTLWPWIQNLEPMEGFLLQQILIEAVTARFSNFEDNLKELLNCETEDVKRSIKNVLDVLKTPIYVQQLSEDGSMLLGERKKVIENDQLWEAHLVEGIWVTEQFGRYYLFYSGNDFSTDRYGIGVAISDSPLGPFKKLPKQLVQSTEKWWAPGHPSIAAGLNGEPRLFLHGYFPHRAGYKEFRALLSLEIIFEPNNVFVR